MGLDQHVVDVAGQHVAFFGDAGLQEAAMTEMAREAQSTLRKIRSSAASSKVLAPKPQVLSSCSMKAFNCASVMR